MKNVASGASRLTRLRPQGDADAAVPSRVLMLSLTESTFAPRWASGREPKLLGTAAPCGLHRWMLLAQLSRTRDQNQSK